MMAPVKSSELVPLNQRLIPAPLGLAFGIATDENFDSEAANDAQAQFSQLNPYKSGNRHRKPSPPRRKQHDPEDAAAPGQPADGAELQATAGLPCPAVTAAPVLQPHVAGKPGALQQQQQQLLQPDASMGHAGSGSAAVQATAGVQGSLQATPSALAAQVAASMQTTSSLSAGYPHQHHHHAAHVAAAHAATAGAAMMHSVRGFPAAAYGFSPHAAAMLPYMGAAPQAVTSNMTGSLGCAPMSVYSGPADYGQMVCGQQEEPIDDNQARALKRPRLVWTPQLHSLFEDAVQKLGLDKAVPKTIMQMMNVEGLTRENVASHLQKYRLSLKKGNELERGAAGAAAGDGGKASSGEKAQQEEATGTSAAATGGGGGGSGSGEAATGSSAGNGGNAAGSCSSSGPDGGCSSSKGTRPDRATSAGTGPAAAAAAAGLGSTGGGPAPQQAQQQQRHQQQVQDMMDEQEAAAMES